MHKRLAILLVAVCFYPVIRAQQPPAQLPSLLEDSYTRTPILQGSEDAETLIRKNIFVKASANENVVYTGQPVLVTYKLYASIFCKSRVSKQPSFNGCSVTELAYPVDPGIEVIDGKTYHVFTIRKIQVTPLEEGPLHLGEVEVENIVPLTRDGNATDNFSITSINEPLILQVKPLPVKDRPKDFSGVVGSFSIDASVDTNKIPIGENATLRITIKGSGNFSAIHLPAIQWPRETEHFEGSDTQHIESDFYPVSGYKTFFVPFIGSKEGSVQIGPISFNYYDPISGSYKIIATGKIPLTFTKAVNKTEQMQLIVNEEVGNTRYLWIVVAIAAVVLIVLIIKMRSKNSKRINDAKEVKSVAPPKDTVAAPQDHGTEILSALNRLGNLEDDKRFLSAAGYLLTGSLQLKLAAPDASADELVELLRRRENNSELAKMCSHIFSDCNRNLYSPDIEEGVKEKIYFELSAVIKKLYPIS